MTAFTSYPPLAVAALPRYGLLDRTWVRELLLIAGAVALLSIVAQISFDVPFSSNRAGRPVPITGQTFGVLLIGVALGGRRAGAAVAAYLALGLLAPVYAQGDSGASVLFTGSSAGYLWGFLVAATVVGFLADRGLDRGPWLFAVLLLGEVIIYAVALPVLELWLNNSSLGAVSVWDAGLWPFIPGDLAKMVAVAVAIPAAWTLVGRLRGPRA